jgi:oxygen-dependent protoporphyrinogen oxidase
VLSHEGLRRRAAEPGLPPVRLDGADVSVGDLLADRLGPEVPDRLVDPLLGGVYAGRAVNLGLRATMPALAARLDAGEGSVLAAAASLVPPPAPDGTRAPVFGTLTGGLGTLVDRLTTASGAVVRYGLPVRALHRRPTGWRLEIGSAPNPEFLDADAVLLAVPAPAARRLLADVSPTASAAYARIELASTAVVALALPGDAPLPDSSGVLIASGERHDGGRPFTAKAFTFSSRKWAHLAGPDHLLVRGSVGRFGEAAILQRDDEDLVAAVRADLAELTGVTATPLDSVVVRWGGGLPQYGVGHLDTVAEIERAVAEVSGLAVAGAALHGVGLPGCVAGAASAAARIVSQLAVLPGG